MKLENLFRFFFLWVDLVHVLVLRGARARRAAGN